MKTVFIDFDGTCVKHMGTLEEIGLLPVEILSGVKEKFDKWKTLGYNVIITTARPYSMKKLTEKQISELGLWCDQLLMGLKNYPRYVINDTKPYCNMYETAFATTVERNKGLEGIEI